MTHHDPDDMGDWPFIRRSTVCVICQDNKALGKLTCDDCRITKTFLSMIAMLTACEQAMRWNAEP